MVSMTTWETQWIFKKTIRLKIRQRISWDSGSWSISRALSCCFLAALTTATMPGVRRGDRSFESMELKNVDPKQQLMIESRKASKSTKNRPRAQGESCHRGPLPSARSGSKSKTGSGTSWSSSSSSCQLYDKNTRQGMSWYIVGLFVHSFIRSFVRSSIHACMHSISFRFVSLRFGSVRFGSVQFSSVRSFLLSFFICSCIRSFVHFIHSMHKYPIIPFSTTYSNEPCQYRVSSFI